MHQVSRRKKKRKKKKVSGWISAADCVDFYADDFGWEVDRWFHFFFHQYGFEPSLEDMANFSGDSVEGLRIHTIELPHAQNENRILTITS